MRLNIHKSIIPRYVHIRVIHEMALETPHIHYINSSKVDNTTLRFNKKSVFVKVWGMIGVYTKIKKIN